MRKRGSILAVTLLTVLVVVACGRASEQDINKALGIEPTATLSGEQIAQATKAAEAAASAIAAGSPVATQAGGAVLAQGDVRLGQQQFTFQCGQCHRPEGSGRGPALLGADSPVNDMTDQQLFDLVRLGEGHGDQPPVSTARLSDRQLASIVTYIRDQLNK
jgi:mono/diheme cytochrome c family protein